MPTDFVASLPRERSEHALADKKPLYTAAEARAESERCLYCADAPCIQACPTEIDIPTFIKKIASGNVEGSASTIFDQNVLGYSCARVCPVEVLCVGSCVYNGWNKDPIQIGRLQRFATETALGKVGAKKLFPVSKAAAKKKIALIGAGPASLACAALLAMEGHDCTIYEKRKVPGGLNATGIAPYKLHAEDAILEAEVVFSLGVKVETGVEIGKDVSGQALLDANDAVYIGVGLGHDSKLGIPGEDGPGVMGAVEWIEEMKLSPAKKGSLGRVIVIGAGNTAIDVARECALLGAQEVGMIYRRTKKEMTGYLHEMNGARKESVRLLENRQPLAFVRDGSGKLTGIEVVVLEGGKEVGKEVVHCDHAFVAVGQAKLKAIAAQFPGVETDQRGCVVANKTNGQTGNAKVFAGGDCINGGKEVVNAVANGRDTARFLLASWSK
ncbi:MAG TPA: FAD-dependent oxidoreductase [Polyangiaceae bacterium]